MGIINQQTTLGGYHLVLTIFRNSNQVCQPPISQVALDASPKVLLYLGGEKKITGDPARELPQLGIAQFLCISNKLKNGWLYESGCLKIVYH